MNRRKLGAAVVTCAVAWLAGTGTAAAGDTVIATVPPDTLVDALGGHVLWSTRDPATGRWQLVDHAGGAQRPVPIATSVEPFDVDLGRDRRGRLVAVYSRCREPLDGAGRNFGRRGCDVFRYDFARSRETRIDAIAGSNDEYEPAFWRRRIGFLRAFPARAGRPAHVRIRLHDLAHRGERPAVWRVPPGAGVWDMDLRGRTLAVQWSREFSEQVRLLSPQARTRVLLSTPGSGAAAQSYRTLHPTFADPHTVYWGLASSDPDWGEAWRRGVRWRRSQHATVRIGGSVVLFAHDRTVGYYAIDPDPADGDSPLELHRVDRLGFERAPRLTLDGR